jgi:hypothetical protein
VSASHRQLQMLVRPGRASSLFKARVWFGGGRGKHKQAPRKLRLPFDPWMLLLRKKEIRAGGAVVLQAAPRDAGRQTNYNNCHFPLPAFQEPANTLPAAQKFHVVIFASSSLIF